MTKANNKATKNDSFIIEMDQLLKRQSRALEIFEAKSSIQSLSKRIICAFAIFGASLIAINAFFIYNQESKQVNESNRKVLGAEMQFFIRYQNGVPISIEIDNESRIHDIIKLAAEQFGLHPDTAILSFQGKKLNREATIANSGLSATCTLEIADYFMNELGNLSKCMYLKITIDNRDGDNTVGVYHPQKEDSVLFVLQMSDTGIDSFKEFQDELDKYLVKKGLVKRKNWVNDYGIEAKYVFKELFVEIRDGKWFGKIHVRGEFEPFSEEEKAAVERLKNTGFDINKEVVPEKDGIEERKYWWTVSMPSESERK